MSLDVRWKQRFQNFDKAFTLLKAALEEDSLSELEQEGTVQRFEYTYELAWKTLKDYLEHGGIEIAEITARNVFKEAFSAKIIQDQEVFVEMMLGRNLLSHVYDFDKFKEILEQVNRDFFPALKKLHGFFTARLADGD